MSVDGGGGGGGGAGGSGGSNPLRRGISGLFSTIRTAKYEHLLAGVSGGVVSTVVLHPLDLLKVRFAVDDGQTKRPHYTSLRHAVKVILNQEGVRGFYKGITPNVAGAGSAWGLYFLFYSTIKSEMQQGNSKTGLPPAMHMLAAAQSGVLTLAMTNPIWVVKTRLCLQYDAVMPAPSGGGGVGDGRKTYKGMLDAFYKIGRYEGMRGLYKGFVPGLWGVSHGAIQFMAYEDLKSRYNHFKEQPIDSKLGAGEYIFCAAVSKLVAAVTTYPYQVVRARLQDQNSHHNRALECIRDTYRNEGVKGFYKGIVPNLTRVVPACAICFVVYEKVSAYLE